MYRRNRINIKQFEATEIAALIEYLNAIALEGWILQFDNKNPRLYRSEPQKLSYGAVLLEDYIANKFIDECHEKGWVFLGKTINRISIFVTSENIDFPQLPDLNQNRKEILKRQIFWNPLVLNIITFIILTINLLISYKTNPFFVAENAYILLGFIIFLGCFMYTIRVVYSLIWNYIAKNKLKTNENVLFYYDKKHKKLFNKIISLLFILMLSFLTYIALDETNQNQIAYIITIITSIIILAMIFDTLWIYRNKNNAIMTGIKAVITSILCIVLFFFMIENINKEITLEWSENENRWVAENQELLPLKLEDFNSTVLGNRITTIEKHKSIIATLEIYRDIADVNQNEIHILWYEILRSDYKLAINQFINAKLYYDDCREIDPTPWKAVAAYKSTSTTIIVYEDSVFFYNDFGPVDLEQYDLIYSLLNE